MPTIHSIHGMWYSGAFYSFTSTMKRRQKMKKTIMFEIRTFTTEFEFGVRSHHWMKFRILHHRTHLRTAAWIRRLPSWRSQPTRMATPALVLPLVMQKKGRPSSRNQPTAALVTTCVFGMRRKDYHHFNWCRWGMIKFNLKPSQVVFRSSRREKTRS